MSRAASGVAATSIGVRLGDFGAIGAANFLLCCTVADAENRARLMIRRVLARWMRAPELGEFARRRGLMLGVTIQAITAAMVRPSPGQ